MTLQLLARRSLVIAGVVASLVVGATSIQVAAALTAASAPLNDPPASLASIQASLEQEQARSMALDEQIQTLEGASSDLAAALDTATGQVEIDTATAEELRSSLAAAKQKLVQLEAALAKAATARAAAATTTSTTVAGPTAEPHDEEDHDDEGGDD